MNAVTKTLLSRRYLNICGRVRTDANGSVAGELGFEPRQTESESVVLPLHHSPTTPEAYAIFLRFIVRIKNSGAGVGSSTSSVPGLASAGPSLPRIPMGHPETVFGKLR